LNRKVKIFIIRNNAAINFLPQNIGSSFPILEEMHITNTSLDFINRKAFDNLNYLKVINLTHNKIKSFEYDTFYDMHELEALDLSNNKMEVIEDGAFDELKKLKFINLNENNLHFIHQRTFKFLINLERFFLSRNSLSVLDQYIFKKNKELKEIQLEGNAIETVNPKIFKGLTKLKQLKIGSENCINDENFETNDVLSIISQNCGSFVSKDVSCEIVLINNTKACVIEDDEKIVDENTILQVNINPSEKNDVIYFIIENNANVKYLPNNLPQIFPNLKYMIVRNTGLVKLLPFKGLRFLEIVDLSNNHISEINPDSFSDSWMIEEINLNGNEIEDISANTFTWLSNLKILEIDNNKMTNLDANLFKNLTNLRTLTLGGNNFSKPIDERMFSNNIHLDKSKIFSVTSPSETTTIKTLTTTKAIRSRGKKSKGVKTTRRGKETEATTTTRIRTINNQLKATIQKPIKSSIECKILIENSKYFNNRPVKICDLSEQFIDDLDILLAENRFKNEILILQLTNGKNVKYFPENVGNILKNLVEIRANNASIEVIYPEDFDEMKLLEVIDLSGNKIKVLDAHVFSSLISLRELNLGENEIEYIDEDAFEGLTSLKSLNLKNNNILFLHPKLFERLNNLETINVDGNNIANLNENLFSSNPYLTSVLHSTKGFEIKTSTMRNKFTTITEPNDEVECHYENNFLPEPNMKLFTCDLSHATINKPNIRVKRLPNNKRVKRMSMTYNKDIEEFPKDIGRTFPNLVEIIIYNTSISKIPEVVLKNLNNLKNLYIVSTNLKLISHNALDMPALETLDLHDNKLKVLHGDTFDKLPSLKALFMMDNKIEYLNNNLLNNLINLQNISLEGNLLMRIERKVFANNVNLQNIWLNNNKLQFIDFDAFNGIRHLEYVDLRDNNCIDDIFVEHTLRKLKNALKRMCTASERIDASENQLVRSFPNVFACTIEYFKFKITAYKALSCVVNTGKINVAQDYLIKTPQESVTGLKIDDNKNLRLLPKKIGNSFKKLIYLSAKNNSITSIDRQDFRKLPLLKFLDISHNSLASIEHNIFIELFSLEDLYLSFNQLHFLNPETFKTTRRLKTLILAGNKYTELPENSFDYLSNLRELDIRSNKIKTLPHNIFKRNANLEKVNLSNNKISSLHPDTFSQLSHLKEVNLIENSCITGTYKSGSFNALRIDLKNKCMSLNALHQPKIEEANDAVKKCHFVDENLDQENSYSCVIKFDDFMKNNWRIEENSKTLEVTRLVIEGKVKKLPENLDKIFPQLTDLVVKNTSLTSLSQNDLKNLKNLNSADFNENDIKYIERSTFANLKNLQKIIFRRNNLRHIDEFAFDGSNNLIELDLSENKLTDFTHEMMENLPNLRILKIKDNKLHTIHENLFKSNSKLYEIHLDGNNLRTIDSNTFERLPSLIYLNLKKNDCIDRSFGTSSIHAIKKVLNEHCLPYKILKEQYSKCLKDVMKCTGDDTRKDLSEEIGNSMAQVKRLQDLLHFERESLRNEKLVNKNLQNEIEQLKNSCSQLNDNNPLLIGLNCKTSDGSTCNALNLKVNYENASIQGKPRPSVTDLKIIDQKVKFLPNGIASIYPNLQSFSIDNSKLEKISSTAFNNLNNLKTLEIKNNDVSVIESNAFDDLLQLEKFILTNNKKFEALSPKAFVKIHHLKHLNLNDNSLLLLPSDILPNNINSITTFTAANNNLRFIDVRIFKILKGANFIDLSGNPCTDESFYYNHKQNDDEKLYLNFVGETSLMCSDDKEFDNFCRINK
jgi:Leucine-rich repeat (LRR) protein